MSTVHVMDNSWFKSWLEGDQVDVGPQLKAKLDLSQSEILPRTAPLTLASLIWQASKGGEGESQLLFRHLQSPEPLPKCPTSSLLPFVSRD